MRPLDLAVQLRGSALDIGMADEPQREPQKAGIAAADLFTGVYSAAAVLSALNRRHETQIGAHIDMSLLDTQVSVRGNHAMNWMTSGVVPRRVGNGHANLVPYQAFPTHDGDLIIAVGSFAVVY